MPFVTTPGLSLIPMADTCVKKGDESWTCAAVYDWTGNKDLAHVAGWLIGRPFSVLCLVIGGLVGRWVLHRVIDRLIKKASAGILPTKLARGPFAEPAGATTAHRRVQRALTMGSLLKSIVSGVVFVIVFMMALAEVGVNIAPLIAGAGILGVALGFGAQSLVKDFLSGIFMIFEDQYGVGDSVTFGDVSGTIEAVSLRVTRMRDVDGTVWYVRNGEILKVGNQSQNWSRTVLDIAVGYKEDITRVRRLLKEVAHDLWEDENYRDKIIEEPDVWGVQSLGPDSVVVRVTLKTLPQQQWVVAREMRERVKSRFDEEGVSTPLPQRVVYGDPTKPPDGPE
jgi:small-conductance mechanosensitive channel